MSEPEIVCEVSLAWWLHPYMVVLCFVAWLMNAEPDPEKVGRVINAAIRIRPVRR